MKIRKIIFIITIIILTIFIYLNNKDNKIYYVNIKDTDNDYYSVFLKNKIDKDLEIYFEYKKEDLRITDLINIIEKNNELLVNDKLKTMENILIKADLITISLGNSYIYYKINYASIDEMYEYFDELLKDYEKLIYILRKYCKEKIIIFGYSSSSSEYDELFNYFNKKLKKICQEKNIYFAIDIEQLKKIY